MTKYEPGTVAVATVRGVENVRVMQDDEGDWWSGHRVAGEWNHEACRVTEIRPLTVLDVNYNEESRRRLVHLLRENYFWSTADQIEAQAKPPRIPEPRQGGVVDAGCVHGRTVKRWVRVGDNWYPLGEDHNPDEWDSLIDPVLVREGVESC